jgi:hypothetical protein
MRSSAQSLLVALQIALLVALTLTPALALAADPSSDPSPSAEASPDPSPEPTPEASPTEEPSPSEAAPTEEPTQAPAPSPTDEPAPTDAPAPTQAPASTDAPTPAPTTAPASTPTIRSDQLDYAPGDVVVLTGAGWNPDEIVHISVNDDAGNTWNRSVDVVADSTGSIRDEFSLPNWFVAVYSVVASAASGTARATFTDADIRFLSSGPTLSSIGWQRYSNISCTTPIA